MKKTFKALLILFLSIGVASLSLAQRQTGSIAGTVIDDEGNALPGVSVTLSGPGMMGTLTFITSGGGDFRFPSVAPGRDYALTVEIAGFQTVSRRGITVNVGKTIRLVIELKPSTIDEEVTVVAPSPTVDVTSTKRSVSYTHQI